MNTIARIISVPAMALVVAAFSFEAGAAPINLSGNFSTSDYGVAADIHGDLDGGVLTLNNSTSESTLRSSLTIDLADPPSYAHETQNLGDSCPLYRCTIRMFPNGSTDVSLPAWDFALGGVADFNAGTANLTADPISTIFSTDTTILNPTFSVVADQDYGPINQYFADEEASIIQFGLNNAGAQITVDGIGHWDTIDLGTIIAALDQGPDETIASLLMDNSILTGTYNFDADVSFARSIVSLVGAAFPVTIQDLFEEGMMDAYRNAFSQSYSSEYGYLDCNASPTGRTSLDVTCNTGMDITLTGPGLSTPSRVDAPAGLGIFALGLALAGFAGIKRASRGRTRNTD